MKKLCIFVVLLLFGCGYGKTVIPQYQIHKAIILESVEDPKDSISYLRMVKYNDGTVLIHDHTCSYCLFKKKREEWK